MGSLRCDWCMPGMDIVAALGGCRWIGCEGEMGSSSGKPNGATCTADTAGGAPDATATPGRANEMPDLAGEPDDPPETVR